MFNPNYLSIALAAPLLLGIVAGALRPQLLGALLLAVYVEHIYLGKFLGLEMQTDRGAWFQIPYHPALFIATALADYLLAAALVYLALAAGERLFGARGTLL